MFIALKVIKSSHILPAKTYSHTGNGSILNRIQFSGSPCPALPLTWSYANETSAKEASTAPKRSHLITESANSTSSLDRKIA